MHFARTLYSSKKNKESFAALNLTFRLKCKEFCENHGIFYFVGNDIHLNALAAILKTHTMVKEGEEVLIVMSKFMDLVFTVKLIREHGHYRYIGRRMFFTLMQLQIIFWDYEPKKLIILHYTVASEEAKNEINKFLKEYNPILFHQSFNYELEKEGLTEKVFHLTGERKSVYDVGVSCSQALTITINDDHTKTIGASLCEIEVYPYELLEEKIPLCISFNEKKPIIGNPALKLYSTKPKFVVFDLIKLSCVSNIESTNSKYKFKLDKEDETFMITVETFEGERRLSKRSISFGFNS
uniref:Uncharacterized protein n=1 Tax=Panagrolaimus sp. PS1159 TaxID=55785 RepID=A0AC35GQW6_9BILA